MLRKNKQFAIYFALMIIFSVPPWPVWGVEWNIRIISFLTLILSMNLLTIRKIKRNLALANLYLISNFYIFFGGLNGYLIPTHFQFSIYIFLLSVSKPFLIRVLYKFEKIFTIILLLGIIIYFVSFIVKLPSFTIAPLNKAKIGSYKVHIFELEIIDYTIANSRRFMSVFDEPGVIGSILALLISYKKIDFKKMRDIVYVLGGLISFSLAFYIILLINLIYNKTMSVKIYLVSFLILGGFYYTNKEFVNIALFDRFIIDDNSIGVVDNRASLDFNDEYDRFLNNGGDSLFFGLGPSALEKLNKSIESEASTYKIIVYKYGIVGCVIFIFFFIYCTLIFAPTGRGWFFFSMFLLVAMQRPDIFSYYNLLIYLSCLSFISVEDFRKRKNKNITNPILVKSNLVIK